MTDSSIPALKRLGHNMHSSNAKIQPPTSPILTYRILALDPETCCKCEDATSLLYVLRSFARLWKNPKVDEKTSSLTDGGTRLEVMEVPSPKDEADLGRAFQVTLSGSYDIEPLREPITGHLKGQEFKLIYVLKDEVSEKIACELYPYLYRIENLLRGYLIKFMATRIGPTWWEVTATGEMSDKVRMRKKNERVFGKYVENSAFLIDFDELGEIIYEQSSGFVTREEILNKISALPETAEAIHELKEALRSNYQKFFKESFADKDFKAKWQEFETLRNKIAHANLFTGNDLINGKRLANELTEIISKADANIQQFVITPKEIEAIQESFMERRSGRASVSEDDFLKELASQQTFFASKGGFVGLNHFVKIHLGSRGYDYRASYQLLDALKSDNKVEVYEVKNKRLGGYPTEALRLVEKTGGKSFMPAVAVTK